MSDRQPSPVYKNHLLFLDAVGRAGAKHTVFGAIVLPWERRGDFSRRVQKVIPSSFNLAKPDGEDERLSVLVDDVFQRRWLSFRAIVCVTSDDAEALRKHALSLLVLKHVERQKAIEPASTWRIRTDGDPKSLEDSLGEVAKGMEIRPVRQRTGVDLAHLFTSAIATEWDKRGRTPGLHQVAERIAKNLGWSDLAADTVPDEWKVNIAYVEDPSHPSHREGTARSVQLRLPLLD